VKIRVLLADDHRIFREGLRRILEEEGQVEVVAEADDGLQAVELARQTRPDVVVMDIGMAITNGIDATRQIVRKRLAQVVVLSMYDDEETIAQAMWAGARGYVPKKSAGRELIDALECVQRGELFLSRTLPHRLREALSTTNRPRRHGASRLSLLTPRQRQVLQLVAEGHTNKSIAALLGIAVETVKSHRKNLKRVLGIDSVARLTRFAIQAGLIRQPTRPSADKAPGSQ
jgi:two-component system response regulator NreC